MPQLHCWTNSFLTFRDTGDTTPAIVDRMRTALEAVGWALKPDALIAEQYYDQSLANWYKDAISGDETYSGERSSADVIVIATEAKDMQLIAGGTGADQIAYYLGAIKALARKHKIIYLSINYFDEVGAMYDGWRTDLAKLHTGIKAEIERIGTYIDVWDWTYNNVAAEDRTTNVCHAIPPYSTAIYNYIMPMILAELNGGVILS